MSQLLNCFDLTWSCLNLHLLAYTFPKKKIQNSDWPTFQNCIVPSTQGNTLRSWSLSDLLICIGHWHIISARGASFSVNKAIIQGIDASPELSILLPPSQFNTPAATDSSELLEMRPKDVSKLHHLLTLSKDLSLVYIGDQNIY